MPTRIKVTGLNHVVLHVVDLERSRRFYLDVLGFEDQSFSTGAERRMSFLRCGNQGLDLFEVADGDSHGGQEMNHLALSVASDDLDEILAELAEAQVETSQRTPRNTVFIFDPDGHRIELLPRPPSGHAREGAAAGASQSQ
jgi:catechol 2,3-dioxygenase-like lactoylglutathione lyase family enzyme